MISTLYIYPRYSRYYIPKVTVQFVLWGGVPSVETRVVNFMITQILEKVIDSKWSDNNQGFQEKYKWTRGMKYNSERWAGKETWSKYVLI